MAMFLTAPGALKRQLPAGALDEFAPTACPSSSEEEHSSGTEFDVAADPRSRDDDQSSHVISAAFQRGAMGGGSLSATDSAAGMGRRARKKSPFLERYRPASAKMTYTPTLMAAPTEELLMSTAGGKRPSSLQSRRPSTAPNAGAAAALARTVRTSSGQTRVPPRTATGARPATQPPGVADELQRQQEEERKSQNLMTKKGGTLRPTSVSGLYVDGAGNYFTPDKAELDTRESKRKLLHQVRRAKYGEQVAMRRTSFLHPPGFGLGRRGGQMEGRRAVSAEQAFPAPSQGLFASSPLDDGDATPNGGAQGVVAERRRKQEEKQKKLFDFMDEKVKLDTLKIRHYVPPPKKYRNLESAFCDLNKFEAKIANRRLPLVTIESHACSTTASTPTDESASKLISSSDACLSGSSTGGGHGLDSAGSSKMSSRLFDSQGLTATSSSSTKRSALKTRLLDLMHAVARGCANAPDSKFAQKELLNKGSVGSLLHGLGNIIHLLEEERCCANVNVGRQQGLVGGNAGSSSASMGFRAAGSRSGSRPGSSKIFLAGGRIDAANMAAGGAGARLRFANASDGLPPVPGLQQHREQPFETATLSELWVKHCPVLVNYMETLPKLSRTSRMLEQEGAFEFFQAKIKREMDTVEEYLKKYL